MQRTIDKNSPTLPSFALVFAMILWASSFIGLKYAIQVYDPMVVIFGRMLVASLCFLVVAGKMARAVRYKPGDYKAILFMAFCEPCLYFLFEAKAIENTTASQAGIITSTLPILVMIAAAVILKEKIGKKNWLGASMAIIGVCWLTLESSPSENAPNPMLGNFLEFLAMVCATGYTISLKKLSNRYSPFFLTATQAFVGCIFYLPLLFLPSTEMPKYFHLTPTLAIIYLGSVITLGAYALYNYGVKHIPANKAAAYVNLIPIFAVLLGWILLGERLNGMQIMAGFLIIGGVFLCQR